jgi:CRP/FNR family cyclic AMP-dependent transcriptional regulator
VPTPTEMLAEVPLFADLDERERAILAERIDVVTLPEGKVVYQHGEPGDALYVVRTGSVELFFKNDEGDRILFEHVGPGEFFGEISLLDGGSRTTSAIVKSDLEALVVDRGDLDELLRLRPSAAMHLMAATGRRLRETARLLRHAASRNINEETEDHRTVVMKVADWISEFSGSLPFLFMHLGIFAVWIGMNLGPIGRSFIGGWDPYPFGLLTMVVSLEAIVLSVFVLLSQNRQVARDRVRNDIEYRVNLKAELEISHLHEKLDDFHENLLARLGRLEAEAKTRKNGDKTVGA